MYDKGTNGEHEGVLTLGYHITAKRAPQIHHSLPALYSTTYISAGACCNSGFRRAFSRRKSQQFSRDVVAKRTASSA